MSSPVSFLAVVHCLRTLSLVAFDLIRLVTLAARPRAALVAENLFLRKQLALFQERKVRPRRADASTRWMMAALSQWFAWRDALVNVQADTLLRWHRQGFRLFWRWKSKTAGRPRLPNNLQALIREMAADNPTWGQERIANELQLKLRIRVSPRTVAKYLRRGGPVRAPDPKQRWLTFVHNHAKVHGHVSHPLRLCVDGSGNPAPSPSQRDRPSDSGVDPAAVPGDPARRSSVPIRAPRPGQHLFPGTRQSGHSAGSEGSPHAGAGADGECLLRTSRGQSSPGVSGFPDPTQRTPFADDCQRVGNPLQPGEASQLIPEPSQESVPASDQRHKLPAGYRVGKTPVLGGLHHEYHLVKEAA